MTDNNSQNLDTKKVTLDIKKVIKTINASPLSDEDKAHWLEILPKLSDDQKNRLYHSLIAKIDVAAAKKAIDKALSIIDQAEAEAEEEIEKEDKQEQEEKAVEEVKKEAETNPSLPEPEEVTKETLPANKADADKKLEELRGELAQISQEAHGSTPPSYNQNQ